MTTRARSYLVCFAAAAALHVGLLMAWGKMFTRTAEVEMAAGESIEMTLVEAAGEPLMEALPPPETEPDLVPPEPVPEPIPEPLPPEPEPPPEPEMAEPRPEPLPPKRASAPRPLPRPATSRPTGSPTGTAKSNPGPSGPTGVRTGAQALSNPRPAYPPAARTAGEQGTVLLSVSVTEQGRAGSVRVARSSGFPRLDEAARTAVLQRWRFRPARIGSIPVASEVEVPVRFQIK